jgi:hypothetical protein
MATANKRRDAATVAFPSGIVSGCIQGDRAKVGREHLDRSRANEIRARLAEWKRREGQQARSALGGTWPGWSRPPILR